MNRSMRNVFPFFVVFLFLAFTGYSQRVSALDSSLAKASAELKTALVNNLKLSDASAAKAAVIESDFHAQLRTINALGNIPLKDKEIKLNKAHVERRSALMALSVTGREMEDLIELSDRIYRGQKM